MRSGVIAQKVGMTRVFTETGEHIPVTVLKLGNCQVLGHRTTEKNGYVALQLGSGTRKTVYLPKAERGQFAVAKVEPKRKVTEFRVSQDALIPVGAEIQADHFVVGQFVDVTGTSVGKGFAGGMKRWNFGGLRATHGVSVSHRSIGSTGGRQDPGKTFKNKKMPGHMGVDRITTLNLRVVQTDVERGLILVEGAVPGSKGGWIAVRDAVKKPLPKDAPKPGKFSWSMAAARQLQRRPSRRAREMELKVTTLEGKEAGSVQLSDEIFGLEPRKDIIQRCVQWQLNKRQAGTHKSQGRADVWRTGKKMYKQKGTGGARHGSARVPQFRGGGRAFGPVVRSHATDLPKKVRALALRHALSAKAKDGDLIVIESRDARGCQDQGADRTLLGSRPDQCADHRRRRAAQRLRHRRPQHSEHRRAADPGHQRL